jgi:hypothetical protein
VIFQALDDKTECVGVYANGQLYFDNWPEEIAQTWKYTGFLSDGNIEYASLYCEGAPLERIAPASLKDPLAKAQRRLKAYAQSFRIAKINLRDHCIFELVPEDFLKEFCEIKNKITEHVLTTYDKPPCYEHLMDATKLLYKIKFQTLQLNPDNCKELFYSTPSRAMAKKLLEGPHYINYNLFGTVTGRLTTFPESFPILTSQRGFRQLIKPKNDWFLSLDYNGAEVRTLMGLSEQAQPSQDIHQWNVKNIFGGGVTREEAKTLLFSWLYNPESEAIETEVYDREKVLEAWYRDDHILTPFGRKIKVDKRKALNYLIQSTTADLVIERAVVVDKMLEGKKSFVSHIVHDELVIDMADEEREMIAEIRDTFADNQIGNYLVNLRAGKNYLDLKDLNL